MALSAGTRLGPYAIIAPLGAGGMGEVYRARDSKLAREIAIKVIPAAFATDTQRMARFAREAQLLASLNHPNIAHIYGLEDAGGPALAMELVEGPTLAERILAGPIPLDEALGLARQIADALEFAHDHGIIHRDLKPANVKLTSDGVAKLLDFGLAKALEGEAEHANISHSPTMSVMATQAGFLLGTAAYMPPEQARGKTTDRRADIWAFGCVLYEMLTGHQLFQGETVTDTLAAVVRAEPDWQLLPAATPPVVRRLLRRCLEKDPKRRFQAIGEARIVLVDFLADPSAVSELPATIATSPQPRWRSVLPWIAAALLAIVAGLALWHPWQSRVERAPTRLSADVGTGLALSRGSPGNYFAISPDGRRIAFSGILVKAPDQQPRIYVRSLDDLQAIPLSGTDGGRDPFFSPDGQWIGFFSDSKLKKVFIQGGSAVTLCAAVDDRGGSWGEDGSIVFSTVTSELLRVSSAGGQPEPVTTLNKKEKERTHRWPQILPGGKEVIFTSNKNNDFEDAIVEVYSLKTHQTKVLARGAFYGRYVSSGHLVYLHDNTLFAVPFDATRLEVKGQPSPVLEGIVNIPGTGAAQVAVSETGTMVYLPGTGRGAVVSIFWMDQQGTFQPLLDTPAPYFNPAFSPDGSQLAFEIRGPTSDIWVYDVKRHTSTRITFDGASQYPVWTPDGHRITYFSRGQADVKPGLFWKRADGAADPQRLTETNNIHSNPAWTPDGRVLAFVALDPSTGADIMTLAMEGNDRSGWKPGQPKPFLHSPALEITPVFSPDGRWIAYSSNESGYMEVYVRPFPGPGGKWQVSSGGCCIPVWSTNRKELFYRTNDFKLMVLNYSATGDSFRPDQARLWSPSQFAYRGNSVNYALHPDGKRVAVFKNPGGEDATVLNNVVFTFNFSDELRRKLPTK